MPQEKFDPDEIQRLHALLYQSGPFGASVAKKSLLSDIDIPEKGALRFEKISWHYGALRPRRQILEVLVINPGFNEQKIQRVEYQGDLKAAFGAWLKKSQRQTIEGSSSRKIEIEGEFSDVADGFYQGQFFFYYDNNEVVNCLIHWAISDSGATLLPRTSRQRHRETELRLSKQAGKWTLQPTSVEIEKSYSVAETTYTCVAPNAQLVYLVGKNRPEKYLMHLVRPGVFQYTLSAGKHLEYYYFCDDAGRYINSFIERTLYFDEKLQLFQGEKPDYDIIRLSVHKPKNKSFKIISTPKWMSVREVVSRGARYRTFLSLNNQELVWGPNKGTVEAKSGMDHFSIEVLYHLAPEQIQPVSVPKKVDLKNSTIDENDVLTGSIPVKVIGRGRLPVSITNPAIESPGFLVDHLSEDLRKLKLPIRIHLKKLAIDQQQRLPLKLFLGGKFSDRQIYETMLILREVSWKRSIRDIVGYLSLYRGEVRRYSFQYEFENQQTVINGFATETDFEKLGMRISWPDEAKNCNISLATTPDKPFLAVKYNGKNRFAITIDTANILEPMNFDIPFRFSLFTNERTIVDQLKIFGEVQVASLAAEVVPDSLEKDRYYSNGRLQLQNLSQQPLAIFSYYSPRNSIKLFLEDDELEFPILLSPQQTQLLWFSYPNDRKGRDPLTIGLRYNNPEDMIIQL